MKYLIREPHFLFGFVPEPIQSNISQLRLEPCPGLVSGPRWACPACHLGCRWWECRRWRRCSRISCSSRRAPWGWSCRPGPHSRPHTSPGRPKGCVSTFSKRLLFDIIMLRVSDPHWFKCGYGSSIFSNNGYRSRVLMTKNCKNFTAVMFF